MLDQPDVQELARKAARHLDDGGWMSPGVYRARAATIIASIFGPAWERMREWYRADIQGWQRRAEVAESQVVYEQERNAMNVKQADEQLKALESQVAALRADLERERACHDCKEYRLTHERERNALKAALEKIATRGLSGYGCEVLAKDALGWPKERSDDAL